VEGQCYAAFSDTRLGGGCVDDASAHGFRLSQKPVDCKGGDANLCVDTTNAGHNAAYWKVSRLRMTVKCSVILSRSTHAVLYIRKRLLSTMIVKQDAKIQEWSQRALETTML